MGDTKPTIDSEQELAQPAASSLSQAVGISDDMLRQMAEQIPDFPDVMERASRASQFEHALTTRDALHLYYKAIAFSIILSLTIIMEGYDTALLGSFYAYPTFAEKFGAPTADGTYQVTSSWQSGLLNGAQVGQILGLMGAGLVADRFGYKRTLIGALVLMTMFIFLMFFAQNIGMLFAAEILCGIPWGVFQTLTVTYAAEVSPLILRPYLTTYANLCWVTGQLISAGVLRSLVDRDEWGWRIPYALQWVWTIPIIVGIVFSPESPWWLVRTGQLEKARGSLLRLTTRTNPRYDPDDVVALMVTTNIQEKLSREGVSYWDCFRGANLRRTEVVCCVWIARLFRTLISSGLIANGWAWHPRQA
jgi:SP family general alpha glucoside:H+ symporter-like MFS transporter